MRYRGIRDFKVQNVGTLGVPSTKKMYSTENYNIIFHFLLYTPCAANKGGVLAFECISHQSHS